MNKIAILQSNFLPWIGYFDIIRSVDFFVVLDSVQYTKNDWRNRNLITQNGTKYWLSVPVRASIGQSISEVVIDDNKMWRRKFCATIKQTYAKAPYFAEVYPFIEQILKDETISYLSDLNFRLIVEICNYLGISTHLDRIVEPDLHRDPNERLIELCSRFNATEYVTGNAARDYLIEDKFFNSSIRVTWFEYAEYYNPLQNMQKVSFHPSILELMFHIHPKYFWDRSIT